jgi:hypothetical protein
MLVGSATMPASMGGKAGQHRGKEGSFLLADGQGDDDFAGGESVVVQLLGGQQQRHA